MYLTGKEPYSAFPGPIADGSTKTRRGGVLVVKGDAPAVLYITMLQAKKKHNFLCLLGAL